MTAVIEVQCLRCKQPFTARVADRNRGWATFCSKACKAIEQKQRRVPTPAYSKWERDQDEHEQIMFDSTTSHGQDGTGGV